MPLQRRLPKFGFKNINRVEYRGINLDVLQKLADKKKLSAIDPTVLIENGLTSKNDRIKILGRQFDGVCGKEWSMALTAFRLLRESLCRYAIEDCAVRTDNVQRAVGVGWVGCHADRIAGQGAGEWN